MNEWINKYDLSDAITELLQGHWTKLSYKPALSVSEEMTQRTGESLDVDRRMPATTWTVHWVPRISRHVERPRERTVAESGSTGGWYDECWRTRGSESATSIHFVCSLHRRKEWFCVSPFPSLHTPTNPTTTNRDPRPTVPLPFLSLSRLLPEFDGQTDRLRGQLSRIMMFCKAH